MLDKRTIFEIHRLKNHRHFRTHRNHFTRHEAELFVVIQHGVHILNPYGIYRTVKHNPLQVGGIVVGIFPVQNGKGAVRPFVRDRVKLSVQMTHR